MMRLSLVLLVIGQAHAHIAMWNKGLFGLNWPRQASDAKQEYNNNLPVVPLRAFEKLPISKWFGHGLKDYPPREGDFMELESGGTFVGELSCNRAWTTMRNPGDQRELPYYACPEVGPLHVHNKFGEEPDPQFFGGTAIAIAYTSEVESLQPGDMIVISVNYTSVWTRETEYKIPCGLPPCPPGGCLCTWNWVHQAWHGEGYGEEIYNNLYRCNVSGEISLENELVVGSGVPPVFCANDPELCVHGPKQPLYAWQAEGNNIPWPGHWPLYNGKYNYRDGAQLDIFGDVMKTQCPEKKVPDPAGTFNTPVLVSEEGGETRSQPVVQQGSNAQSPVSAGVSTSETSREGETAAKDAAYDLDARMDQTPFQAPTALTPTTSGEVTLRDRFDLIVHPAQQAVQMLFSA